MLIIAKTMVNIFLNIGQIFVENRSKMQKTSFAKWEILSFFCFFSQHNKIVFCLRGRGREKSRLVIVINSESLVGSSARGPEGMPHLRHHIQPPEDLRPSSSSIPASHHSQSCNRMK
jgi:hypothetical protein